jgi:hypothetical protein
MEKQDRKRMPEEDFGGNCSIGVEKEGIRFHFRNHGLSELSRRALEGCGILSIETENDGHTT